MADECFWTIDGVKKGSTGILELSFCPECECLFKKEEAESLRDILIELYPFAPSEYRITPIESVGAYYIQRTKKVVSAETETIVMVTSKKHAELLIGAMKIEDERIANGS